MSDNLSTVVNKIVVLGDIHGRTIWKDIISEENPDMVIFLGDYVSTHEGISSEDQISNLMEILDYKEKNPDNVILLRGNHDLQFLGYYWAECSGLNVDVMRWLSSPDNHDRFLKNTQWIYIDKNHALLFSHAGVSKVWLDTIKEYLISKGVCVDTDEQVLDSINNIDPCELFGFTPDSQFDMYGDSVTQPLTWIRPQALCKCNVEGWNQIVGHTPVKQLFDMQKSTKKHQNIFLCDTLGHKEYLVIDSGGFYPKTLK